MRELSELIDVDDPAWPIILAECAKSLTPVEVLGVDPDSGRSCISSLQVTARSFLGALALNTAGLVLDGGWLRVHGANLAKVNGFPETPDPDWRLVEPLIVGHDVLGGVFALNGADPAASGRPGDPGQVTYFAPEAMAWEALQMNYSSWILWLLAGRLGQFYQDFRWSGWEAEVAALTPSQGITFYPPLWSREGRADLAAASRKAVPMRELLGLSGEFSRQLGGTDPGFLGTV